MSKKKPPAADSSHDDRRRRERVRIMHLKIDPARPSEPVYLFKAKDEYADLPHVCGLIFDLSRDGMRIWHHPEDPFADEEFKIVVYPYRTLGIEPFELNARRVWLKEIDEKCNELGVRMVNPSPDLDRKIEKLMRTFRGKKEEIFLRCLLLRSSEPTP